MKIIILIFLITITIQQVKMTESAYSYCQNLFTCNDCLRLNPNNFWCNQVNLCVTDQKLCPNVQKVDWISTLNETSCGPPIISKIQDCPDVYLSYVNSIVLGINVTTDYSGGNSVYP
jgi:hypothetical protein